MHKTFSLKTQYKLIIVSPTLHWSYEDKGQQGVVSSVGSYDKLLTHTLQVSNCYYIEKIVKTIFFNLFLCFYVLRHYLFQMAYTCCSNVLDLKKPPVISQKIFGFKKLFWPFTTSINYSRNLKPFANFQRFYWITGNIFLTINSVYFSQQNTNEIQVCIVKGKSSNIIC